MPQNLADGGSGEPRARPCGVERASRALLVLLLLTAGLRGVAWSLAMPPLHPNDESQHFLRVRETAGDLPPGLDEPDPPRVPRVPLDAHLLAGLVGFGTVEKNAALTLPLGDRAAAAALVAELSQPSASRLGVADEPHELVRHSRFAAYHPPFFYDLVALAYRLVEGRPITAQLLLLRWLSVAMGVAVVGVAFWIGRVLWPRAPGRAAALGALVAFQPMAGFYFAAVNNEAMGTLWLTCVLGLLFYVTRHRLTPPVAVALGLLTTAGLLTKASFVLVAPLFLAVILWQLVRRRGGGGGGRAVWPWVVVALLPVTLTAWWYLPAASREVTAMQTKRPAASAEDPAEVGPSAADYLRGTNWPSTYREIFSEYWGSSLGNAWKADAGVPRPIRRAWYGLTAVGVAATLGWLLWRSLGRGGYGRGYGGGLLLLGLATPCLIAFYQYLDFRYVRGTGGHYRVRGQYLLPALVGQMLWLLFGLGLLVRGRWRAAGVTLLVGGMVLTDLDALFGRVIPRYYGRAGLGDAVSQIALIQPVGRGFVWATLALLLVGCAALLALLATRLWHERELPWLDTDAGAPPRPTTKTRLLETVR